MELTGAIQEALLAILCFDDSPRGAKMVRAIIPATTYDVYFKDIAAAAIKYIDKYEKAPGEHTLDLIDTLKSRQPDLAKIYDRLYKSILTTKDGVNVEYVLNQARLFSRKQSLKAGIAQALNVLEASDTEEGLNEAESFLEKARKTNIDLFNPGILLTDAPRSLAFLDQEQEAFSIGIKEIDEAMLGPARKQLFLWQALYGKGKTWAMCHSVKHLIRQRKRVAWVSLEMSEEKVAQRFMMSLFSCSKRNLPFHRMKFVTDDMGRFIDMKQLTIKERPSFQQKDIRGWLGKQLDLLKTHSAPLYIRQFPTGSLSVKEMEGWLDGLEGACGFIPDAVVVDYPELMDIDPKHQIEASAKLMADLRGVGIKRNCAMIGAAQGNRTAEAAKKGVQGGQHVAGSFAKYATADTVVTYNQTDSEHELGLGRLFVAKGREEKDRFTILISQAYGIGQFCLDSALMGSSRDYWSHIDEEGEAEEGDE